MQFPLSIQFSIAQFPFLFFPRLGQDGFLLGIDYHTGASAAGLFDKADLGVVNGHTGALRSLGMECRKLRRTANILRRRLRALAAQDDVRPVYLLRVQPHIRPPCQPEGQLVVLDVVASDQYLPSARRLIAQRRSRTALFLALGGADITGGLQLGANVREIL